MQVGRRLIFCQPVVCSLVIYGDENEYGNDNGNENEIDDWPCITDEAKKWSVNFMVGQTDLLFMTWPNFIKAKSFECSIVSWGGLPLGLYSLCIIYDLILWWRQRLSFYLGSYSSHSSKVVVQTNLPNQGMTYISWSLKNSTFTWAIPYKSIPVGHIT